MAFIDIPAWPPWPINSCGERISSAAFTAVSLSESRRSQQATHHSPHHGRHTIVHESTHLLRVRADGSRNPGSLEVSISPDDCRQLSLSRSPQRLAGFARPVSKLEGRSVGATSFHAVQAIYGGHCFST